MSVPADRFRVGYERKNLPEGLAAWRAHLAEKAA